MGTDLEIDEVLPSKDERIAHTALRGDGPDMIQHGVSSTPGKLYLSSRQRLMYASVGYSSVQPVGGIAGLHPRPSHSEGT